MDDERKPVGPGPPALMGTRAVLVPVSARIRAHPAARNDAHPCLGDHRFTREMALVRNQPRPSVRTAAPLATISGDGIRTKEGVGGVVA
jgi:hypothetical protein